ncbi:MAG: SAM-dependent methyltransferase [Verrucomicrobiales bacterium]
MIEVGGGDGSLAAGVLRALGRRPLALRYRIVEVSPILESLQRSKLGGLARRVSWHREIKDALAECCGRAVIFSNELADAFRRPRRVECRSRLRGANSYVRCSYTGALAEECRSLRESVRESGSSARWIGNRRPIRGPARRSRGVATGAGSPIAPAPIDPTIDYGGEMLTSITGVSGGTLRAYAHQEAKRGEAIYERPARRHDRRRQFRRPAGVGQCARLGGSRLRHPA